MEANIPAASQLGRALLRLERSGASGTLSVVPSTRAGLRAEGRRASIGIVEGVPVYLAFEDANRLGRFVRDGAMARASGRVGAHCGARWLRDGAITPSELAFALRKQMRKRIAVIFGWSRVSLRLSAFEASLPNLPEPPSATELVVGALRDAIGSVPQASLQRIESESWRMRDARLRRATLYPEEQALLMPLAEGATGADILAVAGHHWRAVRALYAWQLVGLVEPARPAAHGLLLRKRRQMRRRADPASLLDLPPNASQRDARQALRRLVGQVHPDRFEGALEETSTDVVKALVGAEAALRHSVGNHQG